jgi:hypothetical protein
MPVDELHVQLGIDKVIILAPGGTEPKPYPFTPLGEQEISLLRHMRECLCAANDKHPLDDWFDFLAGQLQKAIRDVVLDQLKTAPLPLLRVILKRPAKPTAQEQVLQEAPWELLRHQGRDGEVVLGTNPRVAVTRLVEVPTAYAELGPSPGDKLRVLLVVGKNDGADLGGPGVAATIEKQIGATVEVWDGTTFRKCHTDLKHGNDTPETSMRFDVIHILAHGGDGKKSAGVVEVEIDEYNRMTAKELAYVAKGRCRAVVLQSCSTSGAAPEFLSAGPEAVVAMSWDIQIEPSKHFIAAMYRSLAQGNALDVAVQAGRRNLDADGRMSAAGAPILYARTPAPIVLTLSKSVADPAPLETKAVSAPKADTMHEIEQPPMQSEARPPKVQPTVKKSALAVRSGLAEEDA